MRLFIAACLGAAVGSIGCPAIVRTPAEPKTPSRSPAKPDEDRAPRVEVPAPDTRAARLTPEQWENAVRDLLRLPERTGFSSEFPQDALQGDFLFDNPGAALGVDSTQWAGFQRAAGRAAALVTDDPARLGLILPDGFADERSRAQAFIVAFGRRAHRRPLEEGEIAGYLSVFDAGRTGFPDLDPLTGGVRLVIEAMLQSPYFLYRVEFSDELAAGAAGETIPLEPVELASRLSFALWNSIPDEPLLDAAEQGKLDRSGLRAQASRMVDDPRALSTLLHFHAQLLEARKLAGVSPSPAFYPDAPSGLGTLARKETELFVQDVFATGDGLRDLLTSTRTFVNADLARIYGLEGEFDSDAFAPVQLDPALRRGIFTHVAFLAQNATSAEPDAIHRGVFLARNMACIELSAPPANIPPLPPPQAFQTGRDRIVEHTESASPCKDCHQPIINPFGFPYEMYDAIGAVRTHDNGMPVDTHAAPLLDGETPVSDAVELAVRMADSEVVHQCYARHWLEFALGRPAVELDEPLIERLGANSLQGAGIKELLVELVTSPSFAERSATELGGAP